MATPRLPFLYPNLMRAVRSCEPTTYRSVRIPSSKHAAFHTSRRREQETYHRRYGPAAEANLPPPPRSMEGEAVSQQSPPQSPAEKDKPYSKDPPKQNTSPLEQPHPGETQKKEPESPPSSIEASASAEKEVTTESKETRPPSWARVGIARGHGGRIWRPWKCQHKPRRAWWSSCWTPGWRTPCRSWTSW